MASSFPASPSIAQTDNDVTSDKMTELGIELLGKPENTGGRFFAWAHYMDPHDQYNRARRVAGFGKKARDRYDSEIFYTDSGSESCSTCAEAKALVAQHRAHHHRRSRRGLRRARHVQARLRALGRAPDARPAHHQGAGHRARHIKRAPLGHRPRRRPSRADGAAASPRLMGKSLVPELYGAPPENREPIVVELSEDSHNPPRRGHHPGRLQAHHRGRRREVPNSST